MSNPAYGGLIKIGRTTKDPEMRRLDLSSNTATPSDFKIEYQALVEDHERIELAVHHALDSCRYNDNREFFQCASDRAIEAIRKVGTILHEENFFQSPEELAQIEAEKRRALEEAVRLERESQRKKEALEREVQRQKEALRPRKKADEQKRTQDASTVSALKAKANAALEREAAIVAPITKKIDWYASSWGYAFIFAWPLMWIVFLAIDLWEGIAPKLFVTAVIFFYLAYIPYSIFRYRKLKHSLAGHEWNFSEEEEFLCELMDEHGDAWLLAFSRCQNPEEQRIFMDRARSNAELRRHSSGAGVANPKSLLVKSFWYLMKVLGYILLASLFFGLVRLLTYQANQYLF